MSDNDLIRRGDALNAVLTTDFRHEAQDAIATLPAVTVPHMTDLMVDPESIDAFLEANPLTPTPVDDSLADGPVVKDTRAFDDMARVADEWMHKYEEARQERDDAMALANKTIRQLQAAKSELRNVEFGLADPIAVHQNMLRGTIAKPTVEQIVHLYGIDALCRGLQPAILAEVGAEPVKPADPLAEFYLNQRKDRG